jgi:predicted HAD superfamily Cof-like phosphohydrolase
MNTNFEKVLAFNKAFGAIINQTPQHNIFDSDPELVKNRLSLITEEYEELLDAVKQKSLDLVLDSCIDQVYVIWGFLQALGILNADKAFDLVHESNMSKLCKNKKEAIATVEFYKNDKRYDSPTYKISTDEKYFVVYNESTGKILKSINYKPVSFVSLLKK